MVVSKCEYCGIEKEYVYKSAIKRFCGYECSTKWKWENKRIRASTKEIVCLNCNITFTKPISFLKQHPDTKFCSHACSTNYNKKATQTECPICNNLFYTTRNKYCSRQCSDIGRKKEYTKWEDKNYIKQYMAEYSEKYKTRRKLINKLWKNTEQGKASITATRIKRRNAGRISKEDVIKLKNTKVCYWCGTNLNKNNIHLDHYIPVKLGGMGEMSNMVASCKTCNQKKSGMNPFDFAISIGKLL